MASRKKKNVTPSSNTKQGTLFSFFTRLPPKANSAKPSTTPRLAKEKSPFRPNSKGEATKGTIQTSSHPQSSQDTCNARRASSTKASLNNRRVKVVKVNTKLAVFWQDDKRYYPATVKKVRDDNFFLEYDDATTEWVDLRHEKFRFINDEDEEIEDQDSSDEKDEESFVPKRTGRDGRPSKRPRISDSDDDEFEMDENTQEQEAEEMEQDFVVHDDDDDDEKKANSTSKQKPAKNDIKKSVTVVHEAVSSRSVVTPKVSSVSTHDTRGTTTPTSLPSFSAFSKNSASTASSQTQASSPSRVTPPSSTKTTATITVKRAPEIRTDEEHALPYVLKATNPAGSHVHNHLKFLRNPRDVEGKAKGEPGYSGRTLMVDYEELKKHNEGKQLSPGVQQWWETKAQYFDTVLLFKTGKFYELFHMDADIGVQACGLQYMKGHVAHAGFPEISYGVMAEKLVRQGYRVARCEQTETPEALKERKRNARREKIKNVVNREVCSIMTMGTRTYCYLDDDLTSDQAGMGPLLAIKEILYEEHNEPGGPHEAILPACEYGIVAVDASRAVVTLGQFADDAMRSRLSTLLATFAPSEVLVEGGESGASVALRTLLKSCQDASSSPFLVEEIQQYEIFPKSTAVDPDIRRKLDRENGIVRPWNVEETLEELHRREYFPRGSREDKNSTSTSRWPRVLRLAVEGKAELALSSLGAVLFYLQRNLIDEEILSMGLIQAYTPASTLSAGAESEDDEKVVDGCSIEFQAPTGDQTEALADQETASHMSLDGNTLCQLEILTNSVDHKEKGSLWNKINFTKSPHGARLLKSWLLRPLFRSADINRRADAVEELATGEVAMAMAEARVQLGKIGDIERLLVRIHAMSGSKFPGIECDENPSHPNSRAVLYETKTHTKRKVSDFSKVLHGLRSASRIPDLFSGISVESGLLKKLVKTPENGGCFPDITEELDWFFEGFDFDRAAKGEFEPGRGVDPSFDQACDAIDEIHSRLEHYKNEMCSNTLTPRSLARSSWTYVGTKHDSKDKYIIELPKSVVVPASFKMVGKRGKGANQVCKYQSSAVQELVAELEEAIEKHKERKVKHMETMFAHFDAKRSLWEQVTMASGMLDALGSLAWIAVKPGYCRPLILECPPHGSPCIDIVQGRHPCVESTPCSGEFIPNDLALGSCHPGAKSPLVLLLSGPNMGGKSTLLRQTCLICILAQMGGFVPAEACKLTPVDRIMTRLGASDRILLGYSTFFCELFETATALRQATRRSLIIFDELGRGTSSFDGTAIASACLSYIVNILKCLSLFATHYHSLLDEKKADPNVRLGHMENSVNGADDTVIFHYTLGGGACPKSFGINVARLANLPEEVLVKAQAISSEFEMEAVQKQKVIKMIKQCGGDLDELEQLWESLQ